MEWVAIVEMILAFIQQCQENRANSDIVDGLAKPGPREVAAIRRAIRRAGVKKKKRRAMLERALSDLRAASREELEDFVSAAGE